MKTRVGSGEPGGQHAATYLAMEAMTGAVWWSRRRGRAGISAVAAGDATPYEQADRVPGDTEAADDRLLRRVALADSGALAELYRRHGRPLFGYLLRLCGDRMLAEEILQDTLLAVWRGAGTFQARASVRTWLFGIARRQAHQRLRLRGAPVPVEAAEVTDPALGPDELAILAAGGTAVAGAVARLPDHHREVIGLALVAGLPLAQVAELLSVPVGTVKSRLFHARAALVRVLASAEEVP